MLDDLRMIHFRDSKDMLGAAAKQWGQLEYLFEPDQISKGITGHIENVVYIGTGEAAVAAGICRLTSRIVVPFEVCRPDALPNYISSSSLVIYTDSFGQPAEEMAALQSAIGRQANILVITARKDLAEQARSGSYPLVIFPEVAESVPVTLLHLKALYTALQAAGLELAGLKELTQSAAWLKQQSAEWLPTIPTSHNRAKQIALEIAGKSAVISSGPSLCPAAMSWKVKINRNAKHIAWTSPYPEAADDEFLGWTKQPVNKPYAVIDIRSNFDTTSVQRQFELSQRLLSGLRPTPIAINAHGDSLLRQQLYTLVLGDFVSLYLAMLAGNDPSSVERLAKFKKELI